MRDPLSFALGSAATLMVLLVIFLTATSGNTERGSGRDEIPGHYAFNAEKPEGDRPSDRDSQEVIVWQMSNTTDQTQPTGQAQPTDPPETNPPPGSGPR